MPTHAEKRIVPHKAEQMFDLVADVDRYPEFLPWCIAARVTKRDGNNLYADLVIGFGMFRESFTSTVTLERPDTIHVEYVRGPMRYLSNHWRFIPQEDGGCLIDFYIDFEFRSRLLRNVIGALFNVAVGRMVHAFEERARRIYASKPPRTCTAQAPAKEA